MHTRAYEHLSVAMAAIDQSNSSLAATADAEPVDAGRAGRAEALLLLPAPAAAMPENGPANGVLAEEHWLPAVADAAQAFSLDARRALACPSPSPSGMSRCALPPA